jgi:hypothetical protein
MTASDHLLLPLLKDAAWDYRHQSLCRPLMPDVDHPHIPWVGFGYDHPHSFAFVPDESGTMRRNLAVIERRAIENLRRSPAKWEVSTTRRGRFRAPQRLLICAQHFFAAEHILLPEFLRAGASLIRASRLLVGVPRRGLMVALDARLPETALAQFGMYVSVEYYEAQTAPISPLPFLVDDGRLVGLMHGHEEAGRAVAEQQRAQDEARSDLVMQGLWARSDPASDAETLIVIAGSADLDRLDDALRGAFPQLLSNCLHHDPFGGEIRVIIHDQLTPDSDDLRARMITWSDKFNGIAADLVAIGERDPIRVSVVYGIAGGRDL